MPLLLLIRGGDNMHSAVSKTNRLLAIHRESKPGSQEEDRVLGVWLREHIDVGLPRMNCRELVSLKSEPVTEQNPRPPLADTAADICIGESTSLSDVWALCRIYSSLVQGAADPLQRLRTVIRRLVSPYAMNEHGFFPVFPKAESPENIRSAMCRLREEHPNLIAGTCFVDDSKEGLIERSV